MGHAWKRILYSCYFLIPKAKAVLRPILDLHCLNMLKFRMVSLVSIIPFLDPGDRYASFNLKDAYFHVSIFLVPRRFLSFIAGGHHFQFMALPFGLSSSPRMFTKCMAPVAAYLR